MVCFVSSLFACLGTLLSGSWGGARTSPPLSPLQAQSSAEGKEGFNTSLDVRVALTASLKRGLCAHLPKGGEDVNGQNRREEALVASEAMLLWEDRCSVRTPYRCIELHGWAGVGRPCLVASIVPLLLSLHLFLEPTARPKAPPLGVGRSLPSSLLLGNLTGWSEVGIPAAAGSRSSQLCRFASCAGGAQLGSF